MSRHTFERVMPHIQTSHSPHIVDLHHLMRHVTHMGESCINESCHTYERDMSHVWMSHANIDDLHRLMSHVTHLNGLHYTYKRGVSHIRIRHAYMLDFHPSDACVMLHLRVRHVKNMNALCTYGITHMIESCHT